MNAIDIKHCIIRSDRYEREYEKAKQMYAQRQDEDSKKVVEIFERMRNERGWGNGYVTIPVEYIPLFPELDQDYIDIEGLYAHGGITFTATIDQEIIDRFNDRDTEPHLSVDTIGSVLLGFDTAHWSDTLDKYPKERVLQMTLELKEELQEEIVKRLFKATYNGI